MSTLALRTLSRSAGAALTTVRPLGTGTDSPEPPPEVAYAQVPTNLKRNEFLMAEDTDPPNDLSGAGLALWLELLGNLDFQPHERQLVVELCRTVMLADMLTGEIDVLGPVVDGMHGPKVNPLVAEIRQQRLVIARLTVALNIPEPDESQRPVRRGGPRGVYRKGA